MATGLRAEHCMGQCEKKPARSMGEFETEKLDEVSGIVNR